jgi:hypothetical protein
MAQPLILTLQMDERSQDHFDGLRELHFPPERNYLRASHALSQAGLGLSLWRYLGGPWEKVGSYRFRRPAGGASK